MRKIIGYKERSGVLDNGRPWSHVMVYTTYPSDHGTGDECEQVKVNLIVWDRFVSECGDPLGLEVDVYYNKFGRVEVLQPVD